MMRYPLPWFPLSGDPSRCSCRTIRGCRLYRSSHAECRCGRSGNIRFPDRFRLLRWSSYVPVPTARSRRARCRYRYTCRLSGFPARGGCRLFFEDFGLNQLVMQIVEIVLHLAVGHLAVDQVTEAVVVIGRAV